ncbi:MAG: 4-(cytidine 5'-diphospho)-2-C-methyl-D-erythritol kinase [Magnetococcales bacterium]|nr:4-(cytidine 5'-diphospho)-2-C-methyl-D-erythritol kinase [Magnetococcales bacterium]
MIRSFSAPAKVNLDLKVMGRREDGYHLIESGMTFFPWFDRLEVSCRPDGEIFLECQPAVTAAQEDNLVYRAAMQLKRGAGVESGARIRLFKSIPHGAGLGGGSSDAAVILLALNRMWGVNRSLAQLCDLGVQLGADIPFFLGGGSARVAGIGEKITRCPDTPELELVVVHPGVTLATATVYRGVTAEMIAGRVRLEASSERVPEGGYPLIFENDLEPVARGLTPVIASVADQLRRWGAVTTLMSGSGSAVFGVFAEEETARRAGAAISREQPVWQVKQGRTFNIHPFDREWQSGI